MSYVIQHLKLLPTSWYGGPLAGWVTALGSAVIYTDQASAQAVIDAYRMYAYPAVNPPGQFAIVSTPSSVISGDVVAYADTTGGSFVDSTRQPGTVRQVSILGPGSGTYTPVRTSGVMVVEVQGAGGGGGGVANPGAGNGAIADGGGGGGFGRKFYLIPNQTFTYVVGSKGTGGAAGNNAGTGGGASSFTGSLAGAVTANGGGGGAGSAGGALPRVGGIGSLGTASGGDLNVNGSVSWPGQIAAAGCNIGSVGGRSVWGNGGGAVSNSNATLSTAGNNANGKGGGGSGAVATGATTASAGGDGTDGQIIVIEYE